MVLGAVDDIKAQFAWQEAAEASNSTASGAGSPQPRGRRECSVPVHLECEEYTLVPSRDAPPPGEGTYTNYKAGHNKQ